MSWELGPDLAIIDPGPYHRRQSGR